MMGQEMHANGKAHGLDVASRVDLGQWLDDTIIPSLFERLDSAFPEFGWRRSSAKWIATKWPVGFPYAVGHENPDRLFCYGN
ncbi:MAG TPA: hypothetical protein VHS09_12375, partial [Polyangiaceae bacterium]|nr:hypothetical protein [Polyangiaceae bacterium]